MNRRPEGNLRCRCKARPRKVLQQAPSGGATNYYSKDQQIMRQNALTHATALVVAQGVSGSVFDAQRTVLELAVVYAKFSETGDTSIPELPSGEPGADGEPY